MHHGRLGKTLLENIDLSCLFFLNLIMVKHKKVY